MDKIMIVMTVHTSRRTFLYSKIMIIVTVHTDCFSLWRRS